MRRLLWLGVGLAVGALVVRAVSRKAQAFTPGGIAGTARSSAGNLLDSVRGFVDDVREGMAEREAQIHAAFTEGVALEPDGLSTEETETYPQRGTLH
ncbi:MAG TPA: hypothetical protein VFM55_12890 [Micromonosporaceae bacterium]|nr:hypothetical protein [Micromonosporaceae bacterium]